MDQKEPKKAVKWIKRFGLGAFLFFFLKGMVWLAIFAFAAKSCTA